MTSSKAWHHTIESRHKRGYGAAWDKLRLVILERDRHLCQPCKRAGTVKPGKQVDHIVPKSRGGTDDPGNLQAICDPCHRAKTLRDQGFKPRKPATGPDGWPVEG